MADYKNVLISFQNYFSKKAISRNASKKNDFLSIEIEKLHAKIEANDLIIEENQTSLRDIDSLKQDAETILMNRSTTAIQKSKINQYVREISNR
jgi:hypothetical protein